VERDHHVLEIGSGWGTLAIQVVKETGCRYTGITLSEEQLIYAKRKVKEAGLEVSHVHVFYERQRKYRYLINFNLCQRKDKLIQFTVFSGQHYFPAVRLPSNSQLLQI
jgi:predicted O-methyltransferase YrrM